MLGEAMQPVSATSTAALFSPLTIGSLTVPNRIVMAPMTRNFSPGGVPGPDVAAYYRRRAENGVGLIMTEGTVVNHPASTDSERVPRFFGADALAGWAEVVRAVHAAGGRIMPQLWHVGMTRKPGSPPNPEAPPVGPSGINNTGQRVTEPMGDAEIAAIVEAFGESAGAAMRLGFDGVELHGAHGYLIDEFFWDLTNRRTDRYGGDLSARTRFAADIVRACRRATAPGFPIVLRFSQWKIQDYTVKLAKSPGELAAFLSPLVDAGVDVFHCSTRRFWEQEFDGSPLNLAGWTKKLTGRPTITVGSVGLDDDFVAAFAGKAVQTEGIERLIARLQLGEFDLVAIGRALLADPAWAVKMRDGRAHEMQTFTRDVLLTLR
jgi:2,4-dienoyl-CoA reductase-like NADH-dependent reductase (Old Yellow Enzyme family)